MSKYYFFKIFCDVLSDFPKLQPGVSLAKLFDPCSIKHHCFHVLNGIVLASDT